jgi:hypothetical protein
MRVLRIVLAALLLLQQCTAKCSVAEQKCGTLCCCVTCKCHKEPHRCEDMWGKPTDPVGTEDDERFATPEWSKARHEEHLERHREFMDQHKERMEKRRAEREERRARGENVDEEEFGGRAALDSKMGRAGKIDKRERRAARAAAGAAAFGDAAAGLTAEEFAAARQEL